MYNVMANLPIEFKELAFSTINHTFQLWLLKQIIEGAQITPYNISVCMGRISIMRKVSDFIEIIHKYLWNFILKQKLCKIIKNN